jgi:hypothetical protein
MEFLCNNKKEREDSTTLDLSFLNDSIVNHSASEFPFFLSFFLSFIEKGETERYVERRVRTGLVMHSIQRHSAGAAEKR